MPHAWNSERHAVRTPLDVFRVRELLFQFDLRHNSATCIHHLHSKEFSESATAAETIASATHQLTMTNPEPITRSNLDCVALGTFWEHSGYFRSSEHPTRLSGHRTWIHSWNYRLLALRLSASYNELSSN